MIFTQEEIEGWINDLGEEAQKRDYAEAYKFGFTQGLIAVRARMDDARKAARESQRD